MGAPSERGPRRRPSNARPDSVLGHEVGKGLNFPPEDANVVVFGSLARKEWIDWVSDLDWTYPRRPSPISTLQYLSGY